MIELKFSIYFNKFQNDQTDFTFETGINIIYGESGVGKSFFINSLLKNQKSDEHNFFLKINSELLDSYLITQNPDNQIICRTITSELAFNGECLLKKPSELEKIVKNGIKEFPQKINPYMNPGFLSGGEKEFLNIVTATQLDKKMLLIDDGLSFLSSENKVKVVHLLNKWVEKTGGIVIWITSDIEDLQTKFIKKWVLDLKSFNGYIKGETKTHEPLICPQGDLDLAIENLTFKYENSREIFSKFSLNIEHARCLGLLGNNGSGKTTFAGLCFGDLIPIKGSVKLSILSKENIKIGYLDQFPENLILLDTVDQFLLKLKTLNLFELEYEDTFKKRLLRFGIVWDKIKNLVGIEMPWIMLRVTLVVMLTHCSFEVLILDEPSFGLGWNQRVLLRSFLKESMINKHFIIVSHDKIFAQSICDRIIDFDNLDFSEKTIGIRKEIKT